MRGHVGQGGQQAGADQREAGAGDTSVREARAGEGGRTAGWDAAVPACDSTGWRDGGRPTTEDMHAATGARGERDRGGAGEGDGARFVYDVVRLFATVFLRDFSMAQEELSFAVLARGRDVRGEQ